MPEAKAMKVLFVDDQQSMRGLGRQCLDRLGIKQVLAVPSAEAAIGELQKARFDVIISDQNMEGMSGIELREKIRAHPVLRKTPFILATSEAGKQEEFDSAGNDDDKFVSKPYSAADLRNALESLVGPLQ